MMTDIRQRPKRNSNVRGRRAVAAVLDAATELFASRGYEGTSIADVAARSGVAKPSVLYHFDKERLWKAVIQNLWGDVNAMFSRNWPHHLPPSRALLGAILDLFVDVALAYPAYIRIPFIEGATPSWRSVWLVEHHFARHVSLVDDIIRSLQSQGVIGPGDPAHYQAMMTSSVNVFVAQGALWDHAYHRHLDDAAELKAAGALTLDLICRSDSF